MKYYQFKKNRLIQNSQLKRMKASTKNLHMDWDKIVIEQAPEFPSSHGHTQCCRAWSSSLCEKSRNELSDLHTLGKRENTHTEMCKRLRHALTINPHPAQCHII